MISPKSVERSRRRAAELPVEGVAPLHSYLRDARAKARHYDGRLFGGERERFMERRTFLLASLSQVLLASAAEASQIDPKQTFVLQHGEIKFVPWRSCRPGAARWPSSMETSTTRDRISFS